MLKTASAGTRKGPRISRGHELGLQERVLQRCAEMEFCGADQVRYSAPQHTKDTINNDYRKVGSIVTNIREANGHGDQSQLVTARVLGFYRIGLLPSAFNILRRA